MTTHIHRNVVLAVDCSDDHEVRKVAEVFSAVLAGLLLDGIEARINTTVFEHDDEEEDVPQ